jgi:hypothetical protein
VSVPPRSKKPGPLLRQPDGFEGLLAMLVHAEALDGSIADREGVNAQVAAADHRNARR